MLFHKMSVKLGIAVLFFNAILAQAKTFEVYLPVDKQNSANGKVRQTFVNTVVASPAALCNISSSASGFSTMSFSTAKLDNDIENYLDVDVGLKSRLTTLNPNGGWTVSADWSQLSVNASVNLDLNNKIFTGESKVFNSDYIPVRKIKYHCSKNNFEGEIVVYLQNFTVTPPINNTCTFTSHKDQTVTMRSTTKNALDKGEVMGGHFSLNLNCGRNNNITAAYVAFTDQSTPDNTSNILTLTDQSSAKGVGLKIYSANSGQAVQFSPVQGNVLALTQAHKMTSYQPVNGIIDERYYVKTADILPGDVQGIATVTFFYQ